MSDNHDRAIGRIEGQLKQIIDNQSRAEIGRKQLYELVAAMRAEIVGYKRRIEELEKRFADVEKPVAEINKWRERGLGALMLVSIIAALIGGTLASSWQKIWEVFR